MAAMLLAHPPTTTLSCISLLDSSYPIPADAPVTIATLPLIISIGLISFLRPDLISWSVYLQMALGPLTSVLIMEMSLFSSALINRFHCSYTHVTLRDDYTLCAKHTSKVINLREH